MQIEKSSKDATFRGQRSLTAEEAEGGPCGGESGQCGVLEGRGSEASAVPLAKRKNTLAGAYSHFGLVKRGEYNSRGPA